MTNPAGSRKFQFSPKPASHFAEKDMLLAAKDAGLKFRALGLDDSRTYENNCLHSLKAMLLEAKIAGLKFRALGLDDSRTYENSCLHSLKAMLLEAKIAGLNFRALGLDDSRTYENNCLNSLKAMSLEAKKDARLKSAATFAGAEIWVRGSRMGRAGFSGEDIERASDLLHAND